MCCEDTLVEACFGGRDLVELYSKLSTTRSSTTCSTPSCIEASLVGAGLQLDRAGMLLYILKADYRAVCRSNNTRRSIPVRSARRLDFFDVIRARLSQRSPHSPARRRAAKCP